MRNFCDWWVDVEIIMICFNLLYVYFFVMDIICVFKEDKVCFYVLVEKRKVGFYVSYVV